MSMRTRISILSVLLLPLTVALTSCDAHQDFPDTGIKTGHILCTDGRTYSLDAMRQYEREGKIAKLHPYFYSTVGTGTTESEAARMASEMIPYLQEGGVGTSCDITALDGNSNTYAMYATRDCGSPLAYTVFDLWHYGQSAYIPSVAQMRLMYAARDIINPFIKECGGDVLPTTEDSDWFWTSTEVKDMNAAKAWLYSLSSGAMQETPKLQAHPARPIITLNN